MRPGRLVCEEENHLLRREVSPPHTPPLLATPGDSPRTPFIQCIELLLNFSPNNL
jgi:hypothetical protein